MPFRSGTAIIINLGENAMRFGDSVKWVYDKQLTKGKCILAAAAAPGMSNFNHTAGIGL